MHQHLSPAKIHSQLKHPVVDGDGHWLEFTPVFAEKMRKACGAEGRAGVREISVRLRRPF